MTQITLTRPDDMHLHLRDGAAMRCVLPHTAARFARAIVMPNLRPPITTTALAAAYRARILAADRVIDIQVIPAPADEIRGRLIF